MAVLSSVVRSIKRSQVRIERSQVRIKHIRLQIEQSNELIRNIAQSHHRLRYWLEEQPKQDRESLTKLARQGWFFGPRMPAAAIPQLGRATESAPNEVDDFVGQHVRGHLDDIEAVLIESYPHRSQLFKDAFWAHRERRYSLSVQAFLTQADGIFCDRFGKHLFRKGSKDAVSTFSSEVSGYFFQAVLHPLTQSTPLWEDTRWLEDSFDGLNRHQVLHGMTVDYDTELNSLKAVSLLDYLSWVLSRQAEGY